MRSGRPSAPPAWSVASTCRMVAQQPVTTMPPAPCAAIRRISARESAAARPVTVHVLTTARSACSARPTISCPAGAKLPRPCSRSQPGSDDTRRCPGRLSCFSGDLPVDHRGILRHRRQLRAAARRNCRTRYLRRPLRTPRPGCQLHPSRGSRPARSRPERRSRTRSIGRRRSPGAGD